MAGSQQHIVNIKFNADTAQAKSKAKELQSTLSSLANTKITVQGGAIDQAAQSAKELAYHLNMATNAQTGKLDFSALTHNLKLAGKDLTQMSQQLLLLGPEGQKAFNQLTGAVATSEMTIKKTNGALAKFGQTLMNTIRWQIASKMIDGVTSSFQDAITYTEKMDKALTDIGIVTNKTAAELAGFATRAQKAAKDLNTTAVEYSKAALIFYQQGLPEAEVAERTAATIKMAQVTGDAVSTVSDQLTSIWNNFDDGTKSLEYYVDVITALGAATASSTDEIARGLEKFAAVGETVGLSYEYATAMLATVTSETRQSAEVVGTAFKTLLSRMQDLELGDTLDDGTTLGQYSQALMAVGVNIKKGNGELKDMDDILNSVASTWQTLNKDQQVALAQNVAGVRQYTQFIAIMDNWDVMEENLKVAADSQGALNKQTEIYKSSLEAADERLQQIKEDFFDDFLDADTLIEFKNILGDVITSVGKLFKGFQDALEPIGGLKTALVLMGGYLLKTLFPKITPFLSNALDSVKRITLLGTTRQQKTMNQLNDFANVNAARGAAAPEGSTTRVVSDLNAKILEERKNLLKVERYLTEEQKQQWELKIKQLEEDRDAVATAGEARDKANQAKKDGSYGARTDIRRQVNNEGLGSDPESEARQGARKAQISQIETAEKKLSKLTQKNVSVDEKQAILSELQDAGVKIYDKDPTKAGGWAKIQKEAQKQATKTKTSIQSDINTEQIQIDEQAKQNKDPSKVNLRAAKDTSKTYDENVASIEPTQEMIEALGPNLLSGTEEGNMFVGADISLENFEKLVVKAQELKNTSQDLQGIQQEVNAELNLIPETYKTGTKAAKNMASAIKQSSKDTKAQKAHMQAIAKAGGQADKIIKKYPNNFKKALKPGSQLKKELEEMVKQAQAAGGKINDITEFDFSKIVKDLSPAAFSELGTAVSEMGDDLEGFSKVADEAATDMQDSIEKGSHQATGSLNNMKNAIKEAVDAEHEMSQGAEKLGADLEEDIVPPTGLDMIKTGISGLTNSVMSAMSGFTMLSAGMQSCFAEGASGADILSGAISGVMGAIQITTSVMQAMETVEQLVAAARARRRAKERGEAVVDLMTNTTGGIAKAFSQLGIPGAIAGAVIAAVLIGASMFSGISGAKAEGKEADRQKNEENAAKARDEAMELTKTLTEQADATRNAAVEFDNLIESYENGSASIEDVNEKAKELVETLGNTPEALSAYLSGNYEALSSMAKQATITQSKEANVAAESAIGDAGAAAHYSAQKEGGIYYKETNGKYRLGIDLGSSNTGDETALEGYLEANKEKYKDWYIHNGELRIKYDSQDELPRIYSELEEIHTGAKAYAKANGIDISDQEFFSSYASQTEAEGENYTKAIEAYRTTQTTKSDLLVSSVFLGSDISSYEDYERVYDQTLKDLTASGYSSSEAQELLNNSLAKIDDETLTRYSQFQKVLTSTTKEVQDFVSDGGLSKWVAEKGLQLTEEEALELFMTVRPDLYSTEEAIKEALDAAQKVADAEAVELKFKTGNDLLKDLEGKSGQELLDYVNEHEEELFGGNGLLKGEGAREKFLSGTNETRSQMLLDALPTEEEYKDSLDDRIEGYKDEIEVNKAEIDTLLNSVGKTEEERANKIANTGYMQSQEGYDTAMQSANADLKRYNELMETWNVTNPSGYYAKDENGNYIKDSNGVQVTYQTLIDKANAERDKAEAQKKQAEENWDKITTDSELFNRLAYGDLTSEDKTMLAGLGYYDMEQDKWVNQEGFISDAYLYKNVGKIESLKGENTTLNNKITSTEDQKLIAAQSLTEQRASRLGIEEEELNKYVKALQKANPALKNNTELTYKLALQVSRVNKGVSDLADSFEAWDNNPSELEEAGILQDMLTSTHNLLGLDFGTLGENFVRNTQNFNDLRLAAEGDADAIERLQKAAAEYIAINIGVSESSMPELEATLAAIPDNIPIGVDLATDNVKDEWALTMLEILNKAGATSTQIQEYFNSLGFTVEVSGKIGDYGFESFVYNGDPADTISSEHKKETSPAEEIDNTKLQDTVERYKEINDQLDDMADALDRASGMADRLWGKDRLAMMEQQSKLMEQEISMLNQRKAQTQANRELDRAALDALAAEKGMSFEYDDMGNITNYEEVFTELNRVENEIIDEMKAMSTKEAQGEHSESFLQPIQDYTGELQDAVSTYEDTREALEDTENEIRQKIYEWQDMNFEKLNYTLEINLELNEDQLKWIDYRIGKLEDDIYKRGEMLGLILGEQLQNTLEKADIYTAYEESIFGAYDGADPFKGKSIAELSEQDLIDIYNSGSISQANFIEGMNTLSDSAYEQLAAYDELEEQMETFYSDTLDMAAEELGKITTKFERLTTTLGHYQSVLELTGRSQDYEAIGKILNASVQTNINATNAAAHNYAYFAEQVKYWQEQLALDPSDENAQQNLEAAENHMAEYHDALLTSYETTLEALNTELDNKLAEADKILERGLSGDAGSFAFLDSAFERAAASQEEYLTATNKVYETTKMIRNIQKEIDKTTSNTAKQRLKQFQTETAMLQNQQKLSQFELNIQQKKYDLLLAELALEEAKNTVSTVTLRRDAEGNFGYVYTADQDKIVDAEQKYDDAVNALYNAELDGANNYAQKAKDVLASAQSELSELNTSLRNGLITESEYYAERERIIAYYKEQLGDYVDLYNLAIGDSVLGQQILTDAWSTGLLDIKDINKEFATSVNKYTNTIDKAFEELDKQVKTVTKSIKDIGDIDLTLDTTSINKALDGITTKSQEVYEELVGPDGESGLIEKLNDATTEVNDQYLAWQSVKKEIGFAREEADKLITKISGVKEPLGIKDGQAGNIADWDQNNYSYSGDGYVNNGENSGSIGPQTFYEPASGSDGGKGGGPQDISAAESSAITKMESGELSFAQYNSGKVMPDMGVDQFNELLDLEKDIAIWRYIVSQYKDELAYNSINEKNMEEPLALIRQYSSFNTEELASSFLWKIINTTDYLSKWASNESMLQAMRDLYSGTRNLNSYYAAYGLPGFDTGGYTGEWGPQGKLAMLHEKEIVLNKEDTANFLQSLNLSNQLLDSVDRMASLMSVENYLQQVSAIFDKITGMTDSLEQTVHIDASFPNVHDARDIEDALNNLINTASQYAYRT